MLGYPDVFQFIEGLKFFRHLIAAGPGHDVDQGDLGPGMPCKIGSHYDGAARVLGTVDGNEKISKHGGTLPAISKYLPEGQ